MWIGDTATTSGRTGPAQPTPTATGPGPIELALGEPVERGEQPVGLQPEVDVGIVTIEQLAFHGHQARSQLRIADVDRQDDIAGVTQLGVPSRSD